MFKTMIRAYKEVFTFSPLYSVFSILIDVADVAVATLNTLLTAKVLDSIFTTYTGGMSEKTFLTYIILYLVIILVEKLLFSFRDIIFSYGFAQKLNNRLRMRISEHSTKLGVIEFEKPEVLNLIKRSNSCVTDSKITQAVSNIQNIIKGLLIITGVIGVMASFSVWLIPVAVLSCIPSIFIRIKRGKKFFFLKKSQIPKARTLDYIWKLFLSPAHIKEMRVLGFDGYLADKWEKINDEVNEENWKFQKKDAMAMFLFDLFKVSCYMIGIITAVYLVYSGQLSIGEFGACIAAFASLQSHILNIVKQFSFVVINLTYAQDYFAFLDIPAGRIGQKTFQELKDYIEVKHVSFKYPNTDEYVLEDINLMMKRGEKIALVGENGSGKTTLSKILLGIYPPDVGEVLFDGVDVAEYEKSTLCDYISTVSQNFTKFSMTLRENVAIGNIAEMSDDEKIVATLKRTDILEAMKKTKGLDGMLGREFNGTELSGGQWQKLAIARGLYKDYDFIVLDEPTSALDPIIETEIFKNFLEAMEGKTALIISHRVGLCRMADKIVVMQNGRIVEVGNHDELMEKERHYYKLFTSQKQWYV